MLMALTKDPREEIREELKDVLHKVEPLGAQVLVAVFERPKMTAGGIELPDIVLKEDGFQGKVGMVLKNGPIAFTSDETHRFGDRVPEPGDWVLFSVGDTFPFDLLVPSGKRRCRLVEDVHIRAIVQQPDIVY